MKEMLEMCELKDTLTHLPEYDNGIRLYPATKRLLALEDNMSQIYIPNKMAVEIYSRMYLAAYKAESKKNTALATKQYYENYKIGRNLQPSYQGGVLGGSETFTLIGESGIGKTTAIRKAMNLLGNTDDEVVGCIQVQCPNDCSIKALLLSILQEIDGAIGSDYFERAMKSRPTTDMLIGIVGIACQTHINLLVVDEIQNVRLNIQSKSSKNNGENFIAMLVHLINCTGIAIMLVGTPEVEPVFQKQIHLARRTVGLRYEALPYEKEFRSFCETVYGYQYTKRAEPFSEQINLWLYQHTAGRIALIVSMIKDAQEISIIDGSDYLGIEALEKAYKERYQNIAEYVKNDAVKLPPKKSLKKVYQRSSVSSVTSDTGSERTAERITIRGIVDYCKKQDMDIVNELKVHINIVEVATE